MRERLFPKIKRIKFKLEIDVDRQSRLDLMCALLELCRTKGYKPAKRRKREGA